MFINYLRSVLAVSESLIEPSVDKLSKDKQRELREQQDLKNNAVRTAVLQEGSGDTPVPGDVVYFHHTIREQGSKAVLASTQVAHGGCGCPHVAAIDKGQRIPRGWELVLSGMKPGQRNVVDTIPEYGFAPPCELPRPEAVPADCPLETELELLHAIPAAQAKPVPIKPTLIKTVFRDGGGWQTPRAPFIVQFCWAASPTATLLSPENMGATPLRSATHTMGTGTLPEGLELALSSMPESELACFVIPTEMLTVPLTGKPWVEVPGAKGHPTVHILLELASVEEVRDMTGDGRVLKRKLREGKGIFPVDAPVQDATVTVSYSVHYATPAKRASECVFKGETDTPKTMECTFTTGEGTMPTGLEMAAKLMLPGERCEVFMHADFGFRTCVDPPAGAPEDEELVLVLELKSFVREGHPEIMEVDEILEYCKQRKDRGNALYTAQHFDHAIKRFDHALQVVKSFRGDQTPEQTDALTALNIALLSNSAAAFMAKAEYAEAIRRCDAAFELDGSNYKVVLRRVRAGILNGDYEDADEVLQTIKPQIPEEMQPEVDKLLAWNQAKSRAARRKQKAEFGAF